MKWTEICLSRRLKCSGVDAVEKIAQVYKDKTKFLTIALVNTAWGKQLCFFFTKEGFWEWLDLRVSMKSTLGDPGGTSQGQTAIMNEVFPSPNLQPIFEMLLCLKHRQDDMHKIHLEGAQRRLHRDKQ